MGYEPLSEGIETTAGGRMHIEASQMTGGIRITGPSGLSFFVSKHNVPDMLKAFRHAAEYLGVEELF